MSDLVPLTGESLALDLVNTRPLAADSSVDLLAALPGLRSWLVTEADRIPGLGAALTLADLAAVHAVRDHAAAAIDSARRGERPPAAAFKALNEAQRAAPSIKELTWTGDAVAVTAHRAGPAGARLIAQLAEAAADLLGDPAITSVRECEADDCVMLFLPGHPRRRWCSAARCGNRARVARYYQRHRPSGDAPEPPE